MKNWKLEHLENCNTCFLGDIKRVLTKLVELEKDLNVNLTKLLGEIEREAEEK
jgi:hypothetical protein